METSRMMSPRQAALVIAVDRMIYHLAHHWLALVNTVGFVFVLLPALAPCLMAAGHTTAANLIYRAFSLLCHQLPERTFTIFGYPMAYCERDTAIYTGTLMLGLVFALRPARVRPLGLYGAIALSLPMAIDGLTQIAGLRESTSELRVVTGALFSVAIAGLVFPRLNAGFHDICATLETRFTRLVAEGRARPL